MGKRDIGKEIIEGLEEIRAWKRGAAKLRTFTIELPRAADVPGIRNELGLSQAQFASFMGVSTATLQNWEQQRREPHGPARSLLFVAAKQPAAVRAAFVSSVPVAKVKAVAKPAPRATAKTAKARAAKAA